jgi:hypothetical protein
MLEPALAQLRDGQGLEAQRRRGAEFELGVDLSGQLPGGLAFGPDPGAAALAVVVIEVDPIV